MKKVLLFLAVWFFLASPVWASPFLVCNPDTTTNPPTFYRVIVDGGTPLSSPAQAVTGGVRMHHDVAGLNLLQTHQFTVSACKVNDVGVEVCSATSGFTYPAPTAPAPATGVKLEQ